MTHPTPAESVRSLLRSALSLYWLRPENGLALAGHCLYGRPVAPQAGEVAADFASGDGINTFFKCGGRFDKSFDVFFGAVQPASLSAVVSGHIDVFDHIDDDYQPIITARPPTAFTYATDHKANLLGKAERLGFYRQTVQGDLARPVPDVIPDGSLDYIYSNALYWVADPAAAVAHLRRKLKPGGRAIFEVHTSDRRRLHYAHLYPDAPPEWQDLMERGRAGNNPGLLSEKEWDDVFLARSGFDLLDKPLIRPPVLAHIQNVGLRPLFAPLYRLAQVAPVAERLDIKREWVDSLTDVLLPILLHPEAFMPQSDLRIRLQYVLRDRG